MNKLLVALALTLGLGMGTAYATPEANDQEIQVSGGYFRNIGSGSGSLNADVSYGFFPTEQLEFGLRQGVRYDIAKNDPDVWLATTVPFAEYHFGNVTGNESIVPFAGGFLGAVWNEDDITGTLGPSAGLKVFFNDSTFLVARYRYEWFFEEFEDVNETIDSNHVVNVGLGYLWN